MDTTGAKIAGARVTAEEVTTHYKTTVTSNGSGGYNIVGLNPGTYLITAEERGFGTEQRADVVLTAAQLRVVNVTMHAGGTSETIVVAAESNSLIDTGSANIATTLDQQEVTDLPNEGRNPYVMATLGVGVTNGGSGGYFQGKSSGFTNPYSGVSVQIGSNGSYGHNRLTLNGIPNDPPERLSGNNYLGFTPSPEGVQEVKIGTSIFDAQVGHGNGTVTNVVVRSGTNKLHGAAYYVFQNTYLNANTYERVPNQNGALNPAAPTHRNNDQVAQTGFVIDGPVYIPKLYDGRNKTFFMGAFEFYQTHTALNYSGRVPTLAERNGDFSGLCTDAGGSFNAAGLCSGAPGTVQLYDPQSPVDANGNRTVYFANNQVPTTRSQAGLALLSYYPAPNVAGATSTTSPNYISNQTSYPSSYPSFIARFDQAFGERNKLNATIFRSGLTQSYPLQGFPKGIGPGGYGYSVYRNNRGGSLDDVHQFSSSMVLDSRLGLIWHPFGLTYPGNSNFNLGGIGISPTGLPYTDFPGISSVSDSYATLASGAAGQVSTSLLGALEEVLTKTWARHTVKFGFEGNLLHYNVQNPQNGISGFTFDRTFTRKNFAVNNDNNLSGNPIAALLLGDYTNANYGINANYALRQLYYAGFVQDDWRVTPKLTVNLGLRYDYESPFQERYNKQVGGFCTTCSNPYQANVIGLTLKGGLTYTGNGSSRYPYPPDYNHPQPRLGVAYQVNPTTVVRAGYGIIYFNTLESPQGTGYTQGTTAGNFSGTNNIPITTLANPFPNGVLLPTGSAAGLGTAVGQSVNFYDPRHVQPRATQYAVTLQQQFPGNLAFQIAYVGQRPNHLEVTQNLNALPQQYYNTTHNPTDEAANYVYLTQAIPNPMYGALPATASSSLTGKTIQRALTLVPYPEFGSVNELGSSIGYQRYDALQLQVSKPMSHHVSFQGSFTWNKLINHTGFLNYYGPDSLSQLSGIQDPGASLIATVFGTVELPKLLARPFYERVLLGGWKLNTVMRAQNGSLIGAPGGYDQIGDPVSGSPRNFQRMFNTCYQTISYTTLAGNSGVSNVAVNTIQSGTTTSACDGTSPNPAYRQRLGYTTQTNPQYMNERQRIYPLVDASVFKQFIVREGVSFEIRGEFFNIGNRPNFGGPGTGPGSSSYGVVGGTPSVPLTQANDPRIGQLTARINF